MEGGAFNGPPSEKIRYDTFIFMWIHFYLSNLNIDYDVEVVAGNGIKLPRDI